MTPNLTRRPTRASIVPPDAPRPDAVAVADHLRMLYGTDGGDAPGWLVVFTLPDHEARSFAGDDLFGETPAKIAALAETANVYHGMALLARRFTGKDQRGTEADALVVPGVWLDLDVKGPHHKETNLPETMRDALELLAELPFPPSLVLDSGGGLQVHWLYGQLQVLASDEDRTRAKRLCQRVQEGIRARRPGWKIDATHDLARILRPAGTLNHKSDPPQPVRKLWQSNARYTPADLVALCTPRPKPRHTPPRPLPMSTDHELRSALDAIPADDRDVWLRVGMALHSADQSDAQYRLWTGWSQRAADKFDERDQARTWKSFHADGTVSIATIFHLARLHGWRSSTPTRKAS